ncbi:MAG: hypothetical protein IT235_04750 [Bacteroidia bacterium]|nr:hypothetical protein [Bacteroidia bacterium]
MGKYKINTNREKLSEQEITQHMDFNKFMSGYAAKAGWFAKGVKLYSLISASASVVAVSAYLIYNSAASADVSSVKPFIDPPVRALDIVADKFVLNTERDTAIVYKTGSIVEIPANSFVDSDGNDVKGEVELRYREFHDPIDIMLSGIPMDYDSAGTIYQFESAGMLEALAYQDNKPLRLKPGKTIMAHLVSHTNSDDYNVYYLDTAHKKWNYISENTHKNGTCQPIFDTISLNTEHDFTYGFNDELKKPRKPKLAATNAKSFSIDYNKEEFPELSAYDGVKFEPSETDQSYDPSLANKLWEDVYIRKHPDNEHYIVTFNSSKESHSFVVTPVVEGKYYEQAMKEYENRIASYANMLAKRKATERTQGDSLYRLSSFYAGIAKKSSLNDRFNNFINGNYMGASADMLVYRTFQISNMGLWNCDRPIPYFSLNKLRLDGSPSTFKASFTDKNGNALFLKTAYLMVDNKNMVYPVGKNSFEKFPFNHQCVDKIMGVTYDEKVVYINKKDLNLIDENKNYIEFKMEIANDVKTPEDLKQLLKM